MLRVTYRVDVRAHVPVIGWSALVAPLLVLSGCSTASDSPRSERPVDSSSTAGTSRDSAEAPPCPDVTAVVDVMGQPLREQSIDDPDPASTSCMYELPSDDFTLVTTSTTLGGAEQFSTVLERIRPVLDLGEVQSLEVGDESVAVELPPQGGLPSFQLLGRQGELVVLVGVQAEDAEAEALEAIFELVLTQA